MAGNKWNDMSRSEQEIWSLSLDQLDQVIEHINNIILDKTEELEAEIGSTEQETDEAIDSAAEEPIKETKTALQKSLTDYITFLNILSPKLMEYRNDMADTFQVKDINRKIYLDYLGLDGWIKKLESDIGIDSEYINNIVNDSIDLKNWETQKEEEFSDKCDFNDDDSGFFKSDRHDEKNMKKLRGYMKEQVMK